MWFLANWSKVFLQVQPLLMDELYSSMGGFSVIGGLLAFGAMTQTGLLLPEQLAALIVEENESTAQESGDEQGGNLHGAEAAAAMLAEEAEGVSVPSAVEEGTPFVAYVFPKVIVMLVGLFLLTALGVYFVGAYLSIVLPSGIVTFLSIAALGTLLLGGRWLSRKMRPDLAILQAVMERQKHASVWVIDRAGFVKLLVGVVVGTGVALMLVIQVIGSVGLVPYVVKGEVLRTWTGAPRSTRYAQIDVKQSRFLSAKGLSDSGPPTLGAQRYTISQYVKRGTLRRFTQVQLVMSGNRILAVVAEP